MAKPRPTPPVTTPYDVLGITPNATDEQIKERFDSKMQVFAKSLENEKAGKPIHYAYAAQIATLRAAYRDLGSGEYEKTKEKVVRMGREIDTGHNEEYERLKKVVRTRERFTQKYFESRGEQYEPFMVPSAAAVQAGVTTSTGGVVAAAGGIAQTGVSTGIKALVKKGWTMAAARLGALKAIGSAVGSVLGPLGTIVGGFVLSAIGNAFSKLARSPEQFAEIMLAPLYSFIAMMSAAAAAAMSAATSAASSLFIAAGAGLAFIALIMFIIQAGGYVVPPGENLLGEENLYLPPGSGGGAKDSLYMVVNKVATPPGPLQNTSLPIAIKYTITLQPTVSKLTNIAFTYDCDVVSARGDRACPTDPTLPNPPEEMEPGEVFTFEYFMNYTAEYADSIVMDSFVVTANVPAVNVTGDDATGFASIIFGQPIQGCFVFDSSWRPDGQGRMTQAVAQMMIAQIYTQRLCSARDILLHYNPAQAYFDGKPYGGFTSYPQIEFYDLALSSLFSSFYTLAHESGHIYVNTPGDGYGAWRKWLDYDFGSITAGEGRLCTYPFNYSNITTRASEDFAEMIALYLAGQSPASATRDFSCLAGGNLKTKYPLHWQWARDNIFGQDLKW
ncbi:hypothetical protein C4564_04795 [Candidatus Microgenomates bacterium]|nr:MAG: hypothetical protein C4564_04795 [Candidatus Microgenomates bacterium]